MDTLEHDSNSLLLHDIYNLSDFLLLGIHTQLFPYRYGEYDGEDENNEESDDDVPDSDCIPDDFDLLIANMVLQVKDIVKKTNRRWWDTYDTFSSERFSLSQKNIVREFQQRLQDNKTQIMFLKAEIEMNQKEQEEFDSRKNYVLLHHNNNDVLLHNDVAYSLRELLTKTSLEQHIIMLKQKNIEKQNMIAKLQRENEELQEYLSENEKTENYNVEADRPPTTTTLNLCPNEVSNMVHELTKHRYKYIRTQTSLPDPRIGLAEQILLRCDHVVKLIRIMEDVFCGKSTMLSNIGSEYRRSECVGETCVNHTSCKNKNQQDININHLETRFGQWRKGWEAHKSKTNSNLSSYAFFIFCRAFLDSKRIHDLETHVESSISEWKKIIENQQKRNSVFEQTTPEDYQ